MVHLRATRRTLCSVEEILSFLVLRSTGPGSLLKFENGQFLNRTRFVEKLYAALSATRYPDKSMLATASELERPPQQHNVV